MKKPALVAERDCQRGAGIHVGRCDGGPEYPHSIKVPRKTRRS